MSWAFLLSKYRIGALDTKPPPKKQKALYKVLMRKQGKRAHVSRPVFRLVSYRRLLVDYFTGYCYGVEQTPTEPLLISYLQVKHG